MDGPPAHQALQGPPPRPGRGGVLILNWRDTTNPEGGGSELYVEQVAAGLAAQGRPVTLFCAAHRDGPPSEQVGGVRLVRRGSRLGVYPLAFWLHLTGRLGEHEVVVDVQNGVPFFSPLWCRRPVVALVHHVHREQWRVVLPAPLARFGWWVESWLAPRLYRRARYVAVSEATRRELAGLGVRPEAVQVVHNGAPPPPAAAREVGRTPYPSICVLGRLVPHKRVELALEAAARLRPHLPELRVRVVGQGYWEPRLREAAARLGLGDAVELLGWLDEPAKHQVLASSWVLAMPSLKEGWGLAVLEAASHGTPAVGFRAAGGLCESVVHASTGLLAGDQEEFPRQLAWVLLNRPLRQRLGEAARARAARFTWDQTVRAFTSVLDAAVMPEPAAEPLAPGAGEERGARLAAPVLDQRLARDRGGVLAAHQGQRGGERQQQGGGGQDHQHPDGEPAHLGPPRGRRPEDTNRDVREKRGERLPSRAQPATPTASRSAATTGAAGGAGKRGGAAGRAGTRSSASSGASTTGSSPSSRGRSTAQPSTLYSST